MPRWRSCPRRRDSVVAGRRRYFGDCLSSSSILALNTSPSFSSRMSPTLLPAPAVLASCALVLALALGVASGALVFALLLLLLLGLGRCAAVLARLLPLLAAGSCLVLRLRDVPVPWPEFDLASDFVLDFAPLPADEELDLPSSSFDLVLVEGLTGLTGLAVSSLHRLLSVGVLPCLLSVAGWFWNIGRKKNASAGRELAAVTASVTAANTTAALPVGRMRMGTSIVGISECAQAIGVPPRVDVTQITLRLLGRTKSNRDEPGCISLVSRPAVCRRHP
jgi:hypothetical protein